MLITGGGTNLGRQAAIECAAAGAGVVIAGRREAVLADAVEVIGGGATWVAGGVREAADATRIVDTARERHGHLHVLVNNAGDQYFAPAEDIAAEGLARCERVGRHDRRRRRQLVGPWPPPTLMEDGGTVLTEERR